MPPPILSSLPIGGKTYTDALIGVYCEKSGMFALDIDIDPGKNINGFYSLVELIDTAGNGQALLPKVGPIQNTPHGGQHYLFTLPKEIPIPNTANKLGIGLDLRSNGYICTGTGYTWLPGHEPTVSLKDAPDWLLERSENFQRNQPQLVQYPWIDDNNHYSQDSGDYWLKRALSQAVEGTRNETGFWLACQLRDAGIIEGEAEGIMAVYALRVPGSGYSSGEALASLRSAYRQPARMPAKGNITSTIGNDRSISTIDAEETAQEETPKSKTRWTVAELLDAKLPEPKWAIPDLVPEGLTLLGGRPKVGKSWLALQMAHAIGTGGMFFGKHVERGNVLYVALEDGPRRLQDRIRKYAIPRDALLSFERTWKPLQGEGMTQLFEEIIRNEYRLVVVDTLTRAFRGLDQNDQPLINEVMSNLQRLCQDHHLAMVFNDHVGKPKGFLSDPIDDIMNSTIKTAVADQVLALYKEQGKATAALKGRGRDTEDVDLILRWDPLTCCWQSEGQAGQLQLTGERKELLDALEELGRSQAPGVAKYLGKDRSNIAHRLNDLYSTHLVKREVVGGNVYYEHL